jgi:hypothetical protein
MWREFETSTVKLALPLEWSLPTSVIKTIPQSSSDPDFAPEAPRKIFQQQLRLDLNPEYGTGLRASVYPGMLAYVWLVQAL